MIHRRLGGNSSKRCRRHEGYDGDTEMIHRRLSRDTSKRCRSPAEVTLKLQLKASNEFRRRYYANFQPSEILTISRSLIVPIYPFSEAFWTEFTEIASLRIVRFGNIPYSLQ